MLNLFIILTTTIIQFSIKTTKNAFRNGKRAHYRRIFKATLCMMGTHAILYCINSQLTGNHYIFKFLINVCLCPVLWYVSAMYLAVATLGMGFIALAIQVNRILPGTFRTRRRMEPGQTFTEAYGNWFNFPVNRGNVTLVNGNQNLLGEPIA